MALLAAHLATTAKTNARTVPVTVGQYVVVYAGATGTASATGAPTVTVAGAGLTLAKLVEVSPSAGSVCSLSVYGGFVTAASTGSVVITVDFSASPAAAWTLVEGVSGVDPSSPVAGAVTAGPSVGASMALALSVAPSAADAVRGIFTSRNKTSPATPGAGFGAVSNYGQNPTPTMSALVESRTGSTSKVVDAADLHATNSSTGAAFILRAAPAAPAADEFWLWDGVSLATSPRVDPLFWNGSTLEPLDVVGLTT